MQVGTAVSSSALSHDAPSTTSATSASTALVSSFHKQHWDSKRSTSLSSGSIATVTGRPSSLHHIRSDSTSRDSLLSQRPGRDSMSHEHKRRRSVAIDPSEQHDRSDSIGLATSNRWSHSTTSSLNSNTRRNRSSSGAVLSSLADQSFSSPRRKPLAALDASPRASLHRKNVGSNSRSLTGSPSHSRRASGTEHVATHLTALPPLNTTPSLTDPNDTESASTSHTVPTPSANSYAANEYFENNHDTFHPYNMAKAQRITMVRNSSAPTSIPIQKRVAGTGSQETIHNTRASVWREQDGANSQSNGQTGVPTGVQSRKHRTRERTEKDKKTMLSKALQKANTAVLLDNAQNYEGALEAYGDACDLLGQVMDRTSGDDDRRKLDAIRVTYSNRMEELQELVQERPSTTDEKNLPARPMSDDSLSFRGQGDGPGSPIGDRRTETYSRGTTGNVPRLSYTRNDRDSFFERTMKAVEDSASFDRSDVEQSSHGIQGARSGTADERATVKTAQTSLPLPPPEHTQYMPRPLSPKRPDLPKSNSDSSRRELQREQVVEREGQRERADTGDSTSWLDTIDESGSSCSDSVHSLDDLQGMRRKHIRGTSGNTDPDFDAAFDAAVEAAYNEGLEPDLDAQRKRENTPGHAQNESVQVPASAINEIFTDDFRTTRLNHLDPEDEEEERILDEMALDYGQGFNFDLQSKSALPRQSDSSGYSRSTWQSSQVSDRATAATSLSTVAEDSLADRVAKPSSTLAGPRLRVVEAVALPPPTAPPSGALPPPPNRPSVRARRLSGLNQKQLKIETSPQPPEARKRASTFHHTASPFAEEADVKSARDRQASVDNVSLPTASSGQHDRILQSPPSLEFRSALDEMAKPAAEEPTIDYRPSYEEMPADLPASRPTLFRKNKSSISLRDHTEHTVLLQSPDQEHGPSLVTPMSSTFMSYAAAKRTQNPLISQRANLPSLAQSPFESSQSGGGIHLFDTSLSPTQAPVSPRSPNMTPMPSGLEPCPEPFLLRPFWLMRALYQTIGHPKGGFLSTKLFIPREVWYTKGVKLKLIEDKVANCDLLTAALGRLAGVDTYDADAVMVELQSFEEVMERVQAVLAKKLGSDVGVHGVAGMFKDASAATMASATGNAHGADNAPSDKAAKSNSGKSYLSSWRKLRNKSSGTPLSSSASQASGKTTDKDQHTLASVPMTSYVPVERRGTKRDARNLVFEGPNREYMGSLARLFDGVQVLDQIARQVEDPGLKHSSPTHVGLELSIRHAAEFFGFYVCRFVLTDLGLLMDKFLKRGTEWVLA